MQTSLPGRIKLVLLIYLTSAQADSGTWELSHYGMCGASVSPELLSSLQTSADVLLFSQTLLKCVSRPLKRRFRGVRGNPAPSASPHSLKE